MLSRPFLSQPQLVFATALIKLIFLSGFLTVSSTCSLNNNDLSNVTPRNCGVWLNGTIFSPILMEVLHSNSALDRVNKIDSLFVMLRFNFYFLLKMYTILTELYRAFWGNELAVAKVETLYIAIHQMASTKFFCVVCWFFLSLVGSVLCLPDISGIFFKLSIYRTNRSAARTEPCRSPWWILQLRLILPLKLRHACRFQEMKMATARTYCLVLFISECWGVFVARQCRRLLRSLTEPWQISVNSGNHPTLPVLLGLWYVLQSSCASG